MRRTAFLVAIAALVVIAAPSGALAARLPGPTCNCDGARALALRTPPVRGPDVLDAQLLLRYLGLMRARATGTYGRRTTASVRRFQRLHRLSPDGVLGKRTWPRLRRSALMKARLVRVRTVAAPPRRRILHLSRPRQRGADVLALQRLLGRWGVFHVTPTGEFGTITRAAVRAFQHRRGLPTDGVVGTRTWVALRQPPTRARPPAKPTPAPSPTPSTAPSGSTPAPTATPATSTTLPPDDPVARLTLPVYQAKITFVGCAAADIARELHGLGSAPSSDTDPAPPGERRPRHLDRNMVRGWLDLADRGFAFTIGDLISCHTWHAYEGDGTLSNRLSAHPQGLAYDVTALDGQPITPELQRTPRFAAFVQAIGALPVEIRPNHVISLLDPDGPAGPLFIAQANHDRHVHVEMPVPGV